jgi:hypothetical protein
MEQSLPSSARKKWGCHPCSSKITAMKTLLTPNDSPQKSKTEICIKANRRKKKKKQDCLDMILSQS